MTADGAGACWDCRAGGGAAGAGADGFFAGWAGGGVAGVDVFFTGCSGAGAATAGTLVSSAQEGSVTRRNINTSSVVVRQVFFNIGYSSQSILHPTP
ncbi:hypothetical protein JZU56_02115 [bacterium]|nr:hypothetical protein [bacterium]